MGFSKMLELLQNKNKGYIILGNAGSFYIARGKDAIMLHEILGLKLSCMEKEICKVGFPINSMEKYTKLIEEKEYSFIVYNYNREKNELKILKKYKGKRKNEINKQRENCYICSNCTKNYKKTDKYIEAITKLYEKENKKIDGEYCNE